MTGLIAAGIIIVAVAFYLAVGGAVATQLHLRAKAKCVPCAPDYRGYGSCYAEMGHWFGATLGGTFWPAFLPMAAGAWWSTRDVRAVRRAAELEVHIRKLEDELGMSDPSARRRRP